MLESQCLECQFLLKVVDRKGLRCKAFPSGIPDEILQNDHDHLEPYLGDNGIQFQPIAPERKHEDPEFHHFAVKLRRLHREIITSEELSFEEAIETHLAKWRFRALYIATALLSASFLRRKLENRRFQSRAH